MSHTTPRYQPITRNNFRTVPQLANLSEEEKFGIDVVSTVLPFRTNRYVIDELIDWERIPNDPIYRLTVPQRAMLKPHHFAQMAELVRSDAPSKQLRAAANRIRMQLNPHPAGQLEHNVPLLNGQPVEGIQHKYRETVLFFPGQGQTCHAYCTFCFRWPQFVGIQAIKFASREVDQLIAYLRVHPEVSDVLFTGGDPLIMRAKSLAAYIRPLLAARLPHLKTIRIGSKSLAYWPYKFLTDSDADDTLELFREVSDAGVHLAIMAHFNHPQELRTQAVRDAVKRIRETGAVIRTQSPVMRHINDSADVWATMWRQQVELGMVPYYMFIARDTGAHHYFALPIATCHRIFKQAYRQVSGVCRTVRGPSMSAEPGKVQLLGTAEIASEQVFVLRFLQGRNPAWAQRPFFAKFDPSAIWLDELTPAFGQTRFFFEQQLPLNIVETRPIQPALPVS